MSLSECGADEGREPLRIDFNPVPYTFRAPDRWKKHGEAAVMSPPTWLLLDHTIAVIWSLFSSSAKSLDVDDLKWAHEFLKDVRNPRGENPADVKTCLSSIQDRLIALYADMTHRPKEEVRSTQKTESTNEKASTTTAAAAEEVKEDDAKLLRQKTTPIEASKVPKKKESKSRTTTTEAGKETTRKVAEPVKKATAVRKTGPTVQPRRATQTKPTPTVKEKMTTVKKETTMSTASVASKKETDGDATTPDVAFTEVFQRSKPIERIPTSQSIPKAPAKKKASHATVVSEAPSQKDVSEAKRVSTDSVIDDVRLNLKFKCSVTEDELNNEERAYKHLKNEIRNLTKNTKIPKEQVFKFLSDWREEQVERLQSELKRLNSIEAFMKSVKMDDFTPYVEDDLSQKLESILCSKRLSNNDSRS